MITRTKERFNRRAILKNWNARRPADTFPALEVFILGEKVEEPGAFAVLWVLMEPTTERVTPMRLDCTRELLRELEVGAE